MQMDGIDVFVEVVEAQSFAKAAQRLRMPPATVSARIARLEQRLGVTLIQRTTRRFRVTDAGQTFYRHCARAVAEMREAQQQLSASSDEPAGVLRITAPFDLAQSILLPIVERFLASHARASVDLVVTNRKVDLLSEGIDIAVRAGLLTDSRLIARKLASGRISLWASESYLARNGAPRTPKDLARHAFIGLSLPSIEAMGLRLGRSRLTLPKQPRISCDDIETVRKLVARGNGIGLLPEHVGATEGLVPILPGYATPSAAVSLVYPAQRFVPPLLRAFIDCAVQRSGRPHGGPSDQITR